MNKIGITGGIGSGKTTIAQFFEILGIPVYLSDLRAKDLMVKDSNLILQIKNLIGEEAYNLDNSINTKYVSSKIFNNTTLLQSMNALIHPVVEKDFYIFCKQHKKKPYVLEESAILFESNIYKKMDANILIIAPKKERILRVQKRSKINRVEVEKRISKQWPDSQKKTLADYVITNDNRRFLIPQLLEIHRCIKTLA